MKIGYRYCERAINMSEMLITRTQAAPSSSNYISLAIYRGNCNPFDKAAVEAVRYVFENPGFKIIFKF